MARRFGRNQKRAMRKQIEALQGRVGGLEFHTEQLEALMKVANAKISALSDTVDRTAHVLGRHFATLPAQIIEVQDWLDRYEYTISKPVTYSFDPMPRNEAVQFALNIIDVYETKVFADDLRNMVHMRFESISRRVGYGLSDMAWLRLPEDQLINMIGNQIAPEMAKQLVSHIKKKPL